jgi:SAM-dependent methyltransferase
MRIADAPTIATVYAREPLSFRDSIPVFSLPDDYIENYEKISADHVSAMTEENENPWIEEELWTAMEASTIELVKKYSQPGDTILDVGVGLGRLLSQLPLLQRYGMDISFSYLKRAKAKNLEVCYSRIEDMPYKEDTFDIITATDVLEHVTDLNLACKKILSVLKPGGVLVVRVPYREDLSAYLEPEYPYKYAHLRNFDESNLRLLFERIFDCKCIDWATSVPYLQNPTRLKYRLPKGEGRLYFWLHRIEKSRPKLYKKLAPKLILPIEINVAVKK